MLFAILISFIISLLFAFAPEKAKSLAGKLLPLLPLALFFFFILEFEGGKVKDYLYQGGTAVLPFMLNFRLDALSLMFAMLISGIGAMIFLYADSYMKGDSGKNRLYALLLIFMGSMLGLVLSDHMICMFLFWELTSISSFFLIGFKTKDEASIKSALTALAITGGGGLIMLAGFIILGETAGTYSIAELADNSEFIVGHHLYPWIFALILVGGITKSAQFPFHFWLPGAMKAPTPVSAYLHSATMVKAGVYLFARFYPVLGGTELWTTTLVGFGGVTMIYAAFHSILRTDLKSILAYSTVSALGILTLLIGIGTPLALKAMGLFVFVHGMYKAALFLVAGIIDHETGTRELHRLGGLRKMLIPVAIAGLLAAIANAGIPPALGFIGKELIYEAIIEVNYLAVLLGAMMILTNAFLLAAGFSAGWKPFAGPSRSEFNSVQLPSYKMWFPPLALAVAGILFGVFPQFFSGFLPFLSGSFNVPMPAEKLGLWHGFNTALIYSLITLAVGFAIYLINRPGNQLARGVLAINTISPENLVRKSASLFVYLSGRITDILQNGYLRYYTLVILFFIVGLLGYKLSRGMSFAFEPYVLTEVTIYEAITVAILIFAILFTVFSTSRLVAVASMGVVGLAICLIFVFYSAPDLAMTQFTIDTLTVILFVLVLYRLPRFIPLTFAFRHIRDGAVAIAFGTMIGLLALEVLRHVPSRDISSFYADNAYVLAKGKNIVNVILVDFRGADTMVEIIVLSIAAIGVFSLLKLHLKKNEKVE
jgi:multicomponent Na+:H+ antiporter subunit A